VISFRSSLLPIAFVTAIITVSKKITMACNIFCNRLKLFIATEILALNVRHIVGIYQRSRFICTHYSSYDHVLRKKLLKWYKRS
jgi:hypothetical protein